MNQNQVIPSKPDIEEPTESVREETDLKIGKSKNDNLNDVPAHSSLDLESFSYTLNQPTSFFKSQKLVQGADNGEVGEMEW